MQILFLLGGTLILVLYFLAFSHAVKSVKKCAQEEISCVEELFFQDRLFPFGFVVFFIFVLFSFTLAAGTSLIGVNIYIPSVVSTWLVFCALSLALLYALIRRAFSYTSTKYIFERISKTSHKAAIQGREEVIFHLIDSLVETASKAIYKKNSHLARMAIHQLALASHDYIRASTGTMAKKDEIPLLDRANSVTVYVLRLSEWLLVISKEEKLQPVAEEVITSFGKFAVGCALVHPSLVNLPLIFLERATRTYNDDADLVQRATATLTELAKQLIEHSIEKKISVKDMTTLIFSHLEEIMKGCLEKDKKVNPAILMQPFAEIGDFLSNERYHVLIDREEIMSELKRCLTMFNALDLIPPAPTEFPEEM